MKTYRMLFFGAACLVVMESAVLSQDGGSRPAPPAPPKPTAVQNPAIVTNAATRSDFPVIGHIEKNGRTITIKAGPKGPLYTIKGAGGKVLFENLSAEQLRAQAPDLHEFLKTAIAGNSGKGGPVIDASLGRPAHR